MTDVRVLNLLAQQADMVAWWQLHALGWSPNRIDVTRGQRGWGTVHVGVFAACWAPLRREQRWIAATLAAPFTLLGAASAGAAWGFRPWESQLFETVVRLGSGGPRLMDGLLISRSNALTDDFTWLGPIPITTPERTLLDLAAHLGPTELARATREALRMGLVTPPTLAAALTRHPRRRGSSALRALATRYADIQPRRPQRTTNVRHTPLWRGNWDVRGRSC